MAVFTFGGSFSVLESIAVDSATRNIGKLADQRVACIEEIETLQRRGAVLEPRINAIRARIEETRVQSWLEASKWLAVATRLGDEAIAVWGEEAAAMVESADKICAGLQSGLDLEMAEATSNAKRVYALAKKIKGIDKEIDEWMDLANGSPKESPYFSKVEHGKKETKAYDRSKGVMRK